MYDYEIFHIKPRLTIPFPPPFFVIYTNLRPKCSCVFQKEGCPVIVVVIKCYNLKICIVCRIDLFNSTDRFNIDDIKKLETQIHEIIKVLFISLSLNIVYYESETQKCIVILYDIYIDGYLPFLSTIS